MRTGISYSEDYLDPDSGAVRLGRAIGLSPRRPGDAASLTDYLRSIAKQGEHGQAFAYKTVNTDVLAWVLMRVTGMTLSELLHTRLWAPLGMEQDYFHSRHTAQQGARANAGICHAACDRRSFEMKPRNLNRSAARGAPAPGVAHL
jgi:CubicO group peptidase (beta-lactamase class C family)